MKGALFLGSAGVVFAMSLASAASAGGGLIGDEVFSVITPGGIWQSNPGSAFVIDPGVEFNLDLVGDTFFQVDLDAFSILLDYVATGGLGMGAGEVYELTGLDFAGGVTIIGFNLTLSGGIVGFDATDISFTDHSVTMVLNGSSWQSGNTFALIDLIVTPAPGALALLGMAGLVTRRRRRR